LRQNLNRKINASALGYAISFLLLVGLICSGLLFVASVNKRLERNYSVHEHLVFDNYFALLYGARQTKMGDLEIPHPSGDTSAIHIKNWGAFRVVEVTTRHQQKSITKTALIGFQSEYKLSTLYLPNTTQSLKVCGDTKIEGNASISERGIERAYIAGKNYSNDQLIYGNKEISEKTMPAINVDFRNLTLESFYPETVKIDWTGNDSTFSFSAKTSLITQIEAIVLEKELKGNLIIHSFDSIIVKANAYLENVILISPKIRFEKGFRGSVQAIAHESIICEEDVRLLYPSVLILNETKQNLTTEKREISLASKSKVLGGILLVSQFPDFRKPVSLKIIDALVAGFVYNQGETELQGKIAGHIYTQQFALHAGGGQYTNHLLDATISTKLLPKEFIFPAWIYNSSKTKSEILACF
jgi:hypothetical protein